MNVLEFISALVNSLAWPLVVGVSVAVLRRPLAGLLHSGQVRAVKAGPGGVEVEYFDQGLQEARDAIESAAGEEPVAILPELPVDSQRYGEHMARLATISPSAVVFESFARLEDVLRQLVFEAEGLDLKGVRSIGARQLIRRAVAAGFILADEEYSVHELAWLRNSVAHDPDMRIILDADRALEYADLVRNLINTMLRRAGAKE